MKRDQKAECVKLMKQAEMFQSLSERQLSTLANLFEYKTFVKNQALLTQGSPADKFFLIRSGNIKRTFVDPEDHKIHNVEFAVQARTINSMRILSGEPVFATVKCRSSECELYELSRQKFLSALKQDPDITMNLAKGLCKELRRGSKKFATPLLEQNSKEQDLNIPAVSIAAGIESYYRSALNAMLNARLTGVKAELFPNMHIQVPVRIAYITGFKGLRTVLDQKIDADQFEYSESVRLATTLAPGIIMTPISSVLEATNAGHMNTEPMSTRWMRGVIPRCGREIIFGIGLNQLSDYLEERISPMLTGNNMEKDNSMLANALGSLGAGVISGYFSHVPHNLSTLKLLEPHKSYRQLYPQFVAKSVPTALEDAIAGWNVSTQSKTMLRSVFATLLPRGVLIRTTQIVGSFMILNGTINYLQLREQTKIQRALLGTDEEKLLKDRYGHIPRHPTRQD